MKYEFILNSGNSYFVFCPLDATAQCQEPVPITLLGHVINNAIILPQKYVQPRALDAMTSILAGDVADVIISVTVSCAVDNYTTCFS